MARVQEILEKKGCQVATIGPEVTVLEAARQMNARRIGALVVVEGESIVGMFTERDILTRVVVGQLDPATTRVGRVMTTPVACCRPDTRLEECMSVMTIKRIRHLPVIEGTQLAGIVTSGDLLAREVAEHRETIEHLHQYIYGYS
ncbi:MAG: CBS domain-containing protein [Candidatus Sumerlaeota bacterium]|nr:CBS domain-containing protein [Candidatus Sumerlaeota bacterium]